jgi:transcriptional regulator with XRE-family HTH domain
MLASFFRMEEATLMRDFGARVRRARLFIGLSQEGLAFECGLDRTYISSIERGKRNVSLINIHKLAVSLGVRASVLLEEEGVKK